MMVMIAVMFACVSCTSGSTVVPTARPSSSSAASSLPLQQTALPQVTPELTIDSFAHMPLIGTGFTLESLQSDNGVYKRYSIGYSSNGLYISGILNLPNGAGPFPLVVLNHGYIAPSVYTRGRGLKREQDFLARKGYAVLHSDYRGHADSDESPDVRDAYDAGLEYAMDVVNGVHALCATGLPVYCDDVTMLGHSMGGGVTMNIAVAYPGLVDRIVLYAPVNGRAWENFVRWRSKRDPDDRTVEVLGTPETSPTTWERLSSWTYFDRIAVPILLFQGDDDADVPKEWSDGLSEELQRLGKKVSYVEYSGEGHEFINTWSDFMDRVHRFIGEM